ncbi:MAG: response regulator [Chitinophagales bacterium]
MKLLIVDDERDIEQLYKLSFRKEIKEGNLQLLFAFSGQEAIEVMSTLQPMDIVLLLSDINMPGMTGFDLLEITKKEYPYLKIFMVSAYGDMENLSKATRLGADDFVTKPVDFNLLRDKIFQISS